MKPPKGLEGKLRNFNQFYHDDSWIAENLPETFEFDFKNADRLLPFDGTHPAVMQPRINAQNWKLEVDPEKLKKKMSFRRKALQKIEDWTGWRVSEYRNYKIVK
ncbi:hypothetical protein [Mucilaginibacter aquatilis]|uniref:hypothetical protein n=1 Tax=Mucilaginibacter aquatilis TaxID=1517760 RepID=UPI001E37CE67|nr:hypothetical protein [Mucilaginibacter aquatilis]